MSAEQGEYRHVQYGKVYDSLKPHQRLNIAILGDVTIEIDEENLGLERVSMDNLRRGWEVDQRGFSERCIASGIGLDPFEVFKYYQIQRKVYEVLGKPSDRQKDRSNHVKLSETRGNAMCSEYAILSAFIAQKVGEQAHLIIGAGIEESDPQQWREAHAYVWVNGMNMVFDSVLAQSHNEYPALMVPMRPATLRTLEDGFDIHARRIGADFTRFYGLEAGGFGTKLPQSLQ